MSTAIGHVYNNFERGARWSNFLALLFVYSFHRPTRIRNVLDDFCCLYSFSPLCSMRKIVLGWLFCFLPNVLYDALRSVLIFTRCILQLIYFESKRRWLNIKFSNLMLICLEICFAVLNGIQIVLFHLYNILTLYSSGLWKTHWHTTCLIQTRTDDGREQYHVQLSHRYRGGG